MESSLYGKHNENNTDQSFGLYLHVPYCVHRCSYCDFYSLTGAKNEDFQKITQILRAEIVSSARFLRKTWNYERPLSTLFLGGGTPSLLPPKELNALIILAKETFGYSVGTEVTLEANPETITPSLLEDLASAGQVNRISMGVQSFQTKYLNMLERLAQPETVERAVGLLPKFGFTNFNLDLISGIPGQTNEELSTDLNRAVCCSPSHLSVYQLTLKPGHPLYRDLPGEEITASQYSLIASYLKGTGYEQYEISNFCRSTFQCRHNLLYWTGGDFLGLGPSASSRFIRQGQSWHRKLPSDLKLYQKQIGTWDESVFGLSDRRQTILESAFLELRVQSGVSIEKFIDRFGYDFRRAKKFEAFKKEGLIRQEGDKLYLTDPGRLLADSVTSELVDYSLI